MKVIIKKTGEQITGQPKTILSKLKNQNPKSKILFFMDARDKDGLEYTVAKVIEIIRLINEAKAISKMNCKQCTRTKGQQ